MVSGTLTVSFTVVVIGLSVVMFVGTLTVSVIVVGL
jgi:hypothetical protein